MRMLFTTSVLASVMISGVGLAQAPRRARDNRPLENVRDNLTVNQDIEYAKAGDISLQLDIYQPANQQPANQQPANQQPTNQQPAQSGDASRPCIVWIHGGGWQNGNKSSGINRLAKWVASGEYVGASVGYRLTDKATWPAQIHDCKAAIRFLRKHADEFGIDAERIGVWGSSAGGHLVSLLGTSGDVAELEGELGVIGVSSRVRCVVDFCGPSDFIRFANDAPRESAPGQPVYKLFGGPLKDRMEMAKEASPVTYVSRDDPAFLIVHGTEDRTVPLDQALTFHAAQEKAGMDTTLVQIEGGGHGIGGPEIEAKVKAFFDQHLK